MAWRFHLMDLPSRRWVDRDLTLVGASVTRGISGPGSIEGWLPKGVLARSDIREWGSMLIAEQPGHKPVACIVDRLAAEGDQLRVESGGWSMFPTGQPWLGAEFHGLQVDPFEVVRMVWDHLQSYPDGNLGVVVDSHGSPLRVGIPEDPALTALKNASAKADAEEARLKAAYEQDKKEYDAARAAKKSDSIVAALKATMDKTKAAYDKAREVAQQARNRVRDYEGGEEAAFRLSWWETDDLGDVIAKLASDTGFEYAEVNDWQDDKNAITHRLQLGYPTIGVRRHQLQFEIGVNVTVPPALEETDYASEVLMFGAGEGRKRVRSRVTRQTGRLRRVHVANDPAITSSGAATRAARPVLASLSGVQEITDLDVVDHDSARYGTFGPGDEIRVTGDAGWGQLDMWVRIVELTINCTTGGMSLRVEAV